MNALSKLFETLHLSRRETASRRSRRHRRTRRQRTSLSCETLESKQLLAAVVAIQFSDQVLDTTDPISVAIEGKFEDTAVSGTVVKFETNAQTRFELAKKLDKYVQRVNYLKRIHGNTKILND